MKRVLLRFALMALVLATTAAYVPAEDLEWTVWEVADGGNGHEYTVLMSEGTWLEQAAAAEALGGHLATVLCAEEQEFVFGLVRAAEQESPAGGNYYAFGLLQHEDAEQPAGGWHWLTGEELDEDSYTNWGYREPNNYRGIEHWGALHRTRGTWNDVRNNSDYRAVVERTEPPPPQDTTPPLTSLDEPDPPTLPWSDTPITVTISGSATDAESGVASAVLLIEDEYDELSGELDVTGLLGADGGFSATLELAATVQPGDADGRTYTISLVAADNAGNEADPVSVTVVALGDSAPPLTSLDEPDPPTLPWSDTPITVTISGSATDAESGVASAVLLIEDEYDELSGELDVTGLLGADGGFSATLELAATVQPGDADGRSYTISLVAADNAGNEADPVSVTVVALGDSVPPSVLLNSPDPAQLPHHQPNVLKTVVISGNVTDDESGVASAVLIVSDDYGELDQEHDVTESLDEAGDFEVTLQLSSQVDGGDRSGRTYVITLVATDRAGNGPVEDAVTVVAYSGASGGRGNAPDTPPGHDRRPDTPNRGGR